MSVDLAFPQEIIIERYETVNSNNQKVYRFASNAPTKIPLNSGNQLRFKFMNRNAPRGYTIKLAIHTTAFGGGELCNSDKTYQSIEMINGGEINLAVYADNPCSLKPIAIVLPKPVVINGRADGDMSTQSGAEGTIIIEDVG